MEERVRALEIQMHRVVSDAESEKLNRRDKHVELRDWLMSLERRLRNMERIVWLILGGLTVIEFLTKFLH